MYARVARFEGGKAAGIESESAKIRKEIEAFRRGEKGSYAPELGRYVSRFEVLADRKDGRVAFVVYCETESDLREVDRIMDSMSPSNPDWGKRVSVETYEVFLDESTSLRRVA
ncbi:MAG TPA: hypothetical protein VJ787_10580 [Thermoleophilia bacterium]|nr:hypothetical protein [Thermoleophilia bacterium]